jgi:hypothetical protein
MPSPGQGWFHNTGSPPGHQATILAASRLLVLGLPGILSWVKVACGHCLFQHSKKPYVREPFVCIWGRGRWTQIKSRAKMHCGVEAGGKGSSSDPPAKWGTGLKQMAVLESYFFFFLAMLRLKPMNVRQALYHWATPPAPWWSADVNVSTEKGMDTAPGGWTPPTVW